MAPKPKPKPKPSKPPPHPTPTRQETENKTHEPLCEFTHPCTTSTTTTSNPSNANASGRGGTHPRKLISHIFGRNKTSTKLFPSHVWVHYCRKHYQRARYRSRAWPFTQCDLLLDSLGRMEEWGGVESFEVVLRRREKERISSSSSSSSSPATAEGEGEREGKEGIGLRKERRGTSTSVSACASRDGDDGEDDDEYADEEEESSDDGRGKKKRGKRRRPRIKTCPVPEWLRAETGPGKSFDEIRAIVARIRADLTEQHPRCQTQTQTQKTKGKGKKEQVLFPDIEILPTFRAWVLEQANGGGQDGEGTRKMSRVSRKGAVQKVQR